MKADIWSAAACRRFHRGSTLPHSVKTSTVGKPFPRQTAAVVSVSSTVFSGLISAQSTMPKRAITT